MTTSNKLLLKLISILERKVTYPAQTIERIDHLVEEFLEGLDRQLQSDSEDEDEDENDRDRDRERAIAEELRIAAAAAAATAERSRLMLLKLISIVERRVTYPAAHTMDRIDDLVDEFLEDLKEDVYGMLCSNDLDSSRDTEAEVEAIVRVFPNILSETVAVQIRGELCRFYPIQFLSLIHI